MKRALISSTLVAGLAVLACAHGASARGNDWTITDGNGEGVQVKNGFFGHKTVIMKDRLGDGFGEKKGWFGTKQEQVNVLGNEFSKKKGILGGSDIQGHTIFGDTITTHKGIFGRRTTTVNASGISNLIQGFMDKNKAPLPKPNMPPMGNVSPSSDPLDKDVLTNP